jgi:aryl-alcohol dehydrogenase-like predicted oxidoreductase
LSARNTDPEFAGPRRRLEEQAARLRTSIDALALSAALAQPWADVVLSGAATVEHLISNLRALDVVWDKSAQTIAPQLQEPAAEYWTRRARLPWQ